MIPQDVTETLQAGLDRLNLRDPPAYNVMPFQANFRHPCLKARQAIMTGRGVSTALDVREQYVTGWDEDGTPVYDEEAEFAILYREGTCKSCKERARSRVGRIIETAERPPIHGRVARA